MAEKLARVRWEMGQTLLPDHFIVQEAALTADTIARCRMNGLPDYGVAKLEWNESLIQEGVFSIQNLSLILPTGLLLKLPGNSVVSPFNLNIPGTVDVPIYLHVLNKEGRAADGDDAEEEESAVPRSVHQLALSSEQTYPDAFQTMKIAAFLKDAEGAWRLSDKFIPPMIQVGYSPFLKPELDELRQMLEIFLYKLTQDIADSYLSGESLSSSKQCMKSIYRIQRFLVNVDHLVHVHPYYLYEELKLFYTEVCFFRNTLPENVTLPYEHDRLADCFRKIFEPLRQQMKMGGARAPYLPFELQDGVFRVSLPPEIREADEVYFLIQKAHASQTVSLKNLKVAGFSRISMVHKLALQGVPMTPIDRPPFQHSFGPEVDFFLIKEGEEWDYALRDMTLSFYDPGTEGMNYYIYWRFQ